MDVDVWIRTSPDDYGDLPFIGGCFCNAPDIRVFEAGTDNETTNIHWGTTYDVRVTVRNLGDTEATNTTVNLKYTLPHTAPSTSFEAEDAANHKLSQTVNVPPMDKTTLTFSWRPEASELGAPASATHFCLLAEASNLATLCITYADMAFQNAIGGEQAPYPASAAYGAVHFIPSVELTGEEMVTQFTYIRGAHRVVIGPEETFIHFYSWKELIIPRLRLAERTFSNGSGIIERKAQPGNALQAFVVRHNGSRSVVRCFRPPGGQSVRFHMRVWPLKESSMRYTWKEGDRLDRLAALTGAGPEKLMQLNALTSTGQLRPGTRIVLPYYQATYRMEPWDHFDHIGRTFGYENAAGLADANGLLKPADLDSGVDLQLPGWRFFQAREGDTLEAIDKLFQLPGGSSITVGKVYHPDPNIPFPGETIAVPTASFLKRKRD